MTVGELPEFTPSGNISNTNIYGEIRAFIQYRDAAATGAFSNKLENEQSKFSMSTNGDSWVSKTAYFNHTHNHTLTMNKIGSNQYHNNIPPYVSAYVWLRIS